MKPRILLVNDGRNQNHFGCHAVMATLEEAFKPVRTKPVFEKPKKDDLDGIDFVIVNAEGSTHHGFQKWLYRDYGRPSVMINAVWQENGFQDLSHFSYISVRESLSLESMSNCAVSCKPKVVPDAMLAQYWPTSHIGAHAVISDSVTCGDGVAPKKEHLQRFLDAHYIVAGRFHAACLAIATGKPFWAYPSNTHKTLGMLKDAHLEHLYCRNRADAVLAADHTQPKRPHQRAELYLRNAREAIAGMIADVNELIEAHAS